MRRISVCAGLLLLLAGCATPAGVPVDLALASALAATPPVQPAPGDFAVYRVVNAYNGEVQGEIRYRVGRVEGGRVVVDVDTSSAYAGPPRTEIYTAEGNWLRHTLVNHDHPAEYEFAPPFPAYFFPLDFGKSWSMRVNAKSPATGKVNSVRIDGRVAGSERVVTPGGVFDTIKVVRTVHAGDSGSFQQETIITEIDWYAPALGRAVRSERKSRWFDVGRASDGGGFFNPSSGWVQGDWSIHELLKYAPAAR
jgi:hypothetical protein